MVLSVIQKCRYRSTSPTDGEIQILKFPRFSSLGLSVPVESLTLCLPEHLGDHVLRDGSQGIQKLRLKPGLHDE